MSGLRREINYSECTSREEYVASGYQIVENNDGTVSIYDPKLNPITDHENSSCCTALGYAFDNEFQKCRWVGNEFTSKLAQIPVPIPVPVPSDVFRIVLNPRGNSSAIFGVDDKETCKLDITFDYMFHFDCKKMRDAVNSTQTKLTESTPEEKAIINELNVTNDEVDRLESLIALETSYNIPYVVECHTTGSKIALTETGLKTWATILGDSTYNEWFASKGSDINTYSCDNIDELMKLSGVATIPLYTKTNFNVYDKLETTNRIAQFQTDLTEVKTTNTTLVAQIPAPQIPTIPVPLPNDPKICSNYIELFEELDIRFNLEILNPTTNKLQTVYQEKILDIDNLADYIVNNYGQTGILVGESGLSKLTIDTDCNFVQTVMTQELLDQYGDNIVASGASESQNTLGLPTTRTNIPVPVPTIPQTIIDMLSDWFDNSCWLKYALTVNDDLKWSPPNNNRLTDEPSVLDKIINKEINLSISINNSCVDFAVMLDNIKVVKDCTRIENTSTFISEPPKFELERVLDNKKSWLALSSADTRTHDLRYRETDYETNHHKLILNTKEMDLNLSPARAIESDVCCYTQNNNFILDPSTGNTAYAYTDLNLTGTTVWDISLNDLLSVDITTGITCDEFNNTVTSELIDVKNRQTIQSYPTLKSLYDRYNTRVLYYSNVQSSQFNYINTDDFGNTIGNFWVDLIEQVIPTTTLWNSTYEYRNTNFDQQKFRYKKSTHFFCGQSNNRTNEFPGQIAQTLEACVVTEVLRSTVGGNNKTNIPVPTTECCGVWIKNYAIGSEFYGSIDIIGVSRLERTGNNSISEEYYYDSLQ